MSRQVKLMCVTALTLGRAPLVILFMLGALRHASHPHPVLFWYSLVCLVLSAATDLFDGYFARRFQVTSRFGALADPLTDKIFYLVSLPTLMYVIIVKGDMTHGIVMLWFTVFFMLRDQWVTFLRSLGSEYRADVRANWSGKLRTALSFPIVCVVYFDVASGFEFLPTALIYTLEAAGVAINAISTMIYTRQYWPYLKRSLAES